MYLNPNGYFKKISEISYEYLKENNIKGLILDVDNTLIDFYNNFSQENIDWINNLKEKDIKMCILSNSNNKNKIKKIAQTLNIDYIYFAMKPLKRGFIKAKNTLKLENNEIATIGDQIFTDVIGANRLGMFSILVDPISKKDIWLTVIKRPIENCIKNRYLKTKEK